MRYVNTSLLKLMIYLFIIIQNPWICASQYLHVGLPPDACGMFSVFNYIAGILFHYDKGEYAGLEVDFENVGLYYDPLHGSNWWEYYCEPIRLGNKENTTIFQLRNYRDYDGFAYFTERQLSRESVFLIIQKYIKIKNHIQKKVDDFILENFTDNYVITLHYRGTDKIVEANSIPYEEVAQKINNYIKENELKNYKIFLASDEQKFIDFMQNLFSDSLITYEAHRSHDGIPLHMQSTDKFQIGEEALIDCLLLSKGNVLIRTSSNLSLWSTYFNPFIPVIVLNRRR